MHSCAAPIKSNAQLTSVAENPCAFRDRGRSRALPENQRSEIRDQNSLISSLRRWKILVHFVTAKGGAHFQFTYLNGIRRRAHGIWVELVAVFVGETEKRVRHGLAGADRADLHAVERPSDVKP
jgi:hypothetical protein